MFLYDTLKHMRQGKVKFGFMWRKWVLKLVAANFTPRFTPPLRSLKFAFSCCDSFFLCTRGFPVSWGYFFSFEEGLDAVRDSDNRLKLTLTSPICCAAWLPMRFAQVWSAMTMKLIYLVFLFDSWVCHLYHALACRIESSRVEHC